VEQKCRRVLFSLFRRRSRRPRRARTRARSAVGVVGSTRVGDLAWAARVTFRGGGARRFVLSSLVCFVPA
jgi:hypothetical protein